MTESPSTPQAGLIDIVEAFTAMRHEFRTQTVESRGVADQIAAAQQRIEQFEQQIGETIQAWRRAADESQADQGDARRGDSDALKLAQSLAELDLYLSRSVESAITAIRNSVQTIAPEHLQRQLDAELSRSGFWSRRSHRAFGQRLIAATHSEMEKAKLIAESAASGLEMSIDRVRTQLRHCDIERIDCVGEPFDAELMNAVEAIESREYPPGHVADQLAPAYRWNGQLLRFAEVRVTKSAVTGG